MENVRIIDNSMSQKKVDRKFIAKAIATIQWNRFFRGFSAKKDVDGFGKKTIFNQFSNAFHIESKKLITLKEQLINCKRNIIMNNAELMIQEYTYNSKILLEKKGFK